jgi:hypothetical protein
MWFHFRFILDPGSENFSFSYWMSNLNWAENNNSMVQNHIQLVFLPSLTK